METLDNFSRACGDARDAFVESLVNRYNPKTSSIKATHFKVSFFASNIMISLLQRLSAHPLWSQLADDLTLFVSRERADPNI